MSPSVSSFRCHAFVVARPSRSLSRNRAGLHFLATPPLPTIRENAGFRISAFPRKSFVTKQLGVPGEISSRWEEDERRSEQGNGQF